jgi:hypothetical protein
VCSASQGLSILISFLCYKTDLYLCVQFRDYWAKMISEKPWGIRVRARVGLRHDLRREPTEREVDKAVVKKYENMLPDRISQAFTLGQEVSLVLGFVGSFCIVFWAIY